MCILFVLVYAVPISKTEFEMLSIPMSWGMVNSVGCSAFLGPTLFELAMLGFLIRYLLFLMLPVVVVIRCIISLELG